MCKSRLTPLSLQPSPGCCCCPGLSSWLLFRSHHSLSSQGGRGFACSMLKCHESSQSTKTPAPPLEGAGHRERIIIIRHCVYGNDPAEAGWGLKKSLGFLYYQSPCRRNWSPRFLLPGSRSLASKSKHTWLRGAGWKAGLLGNRVGPVL